MGENVYSYVRGNGLASYFDGTNVGIYTSNLHGDVSQIIAYGQKSLVKYGFDAFGNENSAANTVHNPFGYCGEYRDEETGFIYLRARYYAPEVGRFISEDPAKDGVNWYVYCGNNPVMYVDPWGLDSYVLYDPDIFGDGTGKQYAEILKSDLESFYNTDAHIIAVDSAKSFEKEWKNLPNDMDGVVVFAHGSGIWLEFGTHSSKFDIKNNEMALNSYFTGVNNLSSKSAKTITLLSCSAARYEDGIADMFAKRMDVDKVIASNRDCLIAIKTPWYGFNKWFKYTDIVVKDEGAFYSIKRDSNGNISKTELGDRFKGLSKILKAAKKL